MENKDIKISIELTEDEAHAFSRFLNRLDADYYEEILGDDDEVVLVWKVVERLEEAIETANSELCESNPETIK